MEQVNLSIHPKCDIVIYGAGEPLDATYMQYRYLWYRRTFRRYLYAISLFMVQVNLSMQPICNIVIYGTGEPLDATQMRYRYL